MAKVKRIFSDDYLFRGKYVAMVNDLTTEIDPHSGATIFNSAVELYLTAAIVGAHYQLTANPDNTGDSKRIMASQFSNHYNDLKFAYQLVMLNADRDELSAVDRVNNAFRYSEADPEYPKNVATFERYMLGGLVFLHNCFIKSTNTHYEDYRISMDELIADMSGKKSENNDDEDIDFGPVF